MNVRVQGERLLVKQDEKETKTQGGIYLPEHTEKTKPSTGTIVKIGNGKYTMEALKEGERVMFDQYAGIKVELEGQEYKVLNYTDVLMTL